MGDLADDSRLKRNGGEKQKFFTPGFPSIQQVKILNICNLVYHREKKKSNDILIQIQKR